jgi:S1-C subfamily serine protease
MPNFAAGTVACAIAIAAGAIAAPVAPAIAASANGTAWCHDTARDLVTQRPVEACQGRMVDETEADRIRERRRARIRRSLGGVKGAVPRGRMGGSGTGFFIARDGTLVTNAHVIDGCSTMVVEAADNEKGTARVLGVDARNDLALLRADIVPKAVADFASLREPEFDEPVAIVGFPLHGRVAIKPILVTGHVLDNARARRGHAGRFRMRADVRRGNSGGPVLDGQGLVIGVVAAKVHTPRTFQATGRLVRDVGVAIAPETVFSFLEAQNQPHRRSVDGVPMSDAEIMARARRFVVRLVCWR